MGAGFWVPWVPVGAGFGVPWVPCPRRAPRTGEPWRSERLLLNREALAPGALPALVPPLSAVGEDFVRRARAQASQSGQGSWSGDFSQELFRFALECECGMGWATKTAKKKREKKFSQKFRTSKTAKKSLKI